MDSPAAATRNTLTWPWLLNPQTDQIEVLNRIGQRILLIDNEIQEQTSIDASSWSSGIYIVRVITNQGDVICKKLIKE